MGKIVFERDFCPDADVSTIQEIEAVIAFKNYIEQEFIAVSNRVIENGTKESLFSCSDYSVCLYAVANCAATKIQTDDEMVLLSLFDDSEIQSISKILSEDTGFLECAATFILVNNINPFNIDSIWATIKNQLKQKE